MTDQSLPSWDAPEDAELGTAGPLLQTAVPGPVGRTWVDRLAAVECPAIVARRVRRAEVSGQEHDPVVWERALGSNVWDPDGNRYVDLLGGFGVASAGHANPHVLDAVRRQLGRLVHGLGDAFPGRPRIELAEALGRITPGALQQSIFCSTGSEAVEAALKTAMMATGRSGIVAFEGGYHGISLGALSVSHYKEAFREPFAGRLGSQAAYLPFGASAEDLRAALGSGAERPAAVLVEPVQGRGGNRCAEAGWFAQLRELCTALDVVLIFDEVFTGFGRTGTWFAAGSEALDGVVPDLLCLGKGMSSGFPISACIGNQEVMGAWGLSRGEAIHTSTFLGHPVGCAAALAVIELFEAGGLLERGAALGERMGRDLQGLAAAHPKQLASVRGRGAMRGLAIRPAAGKPPVALSLRLCRSLLERGYLLLPAGVQGEVLSFTPPLVLSESQWSGAVEALEAVLVEAAFGD